MRIKINGTEYAAKSLDKGRVRDVAELQRQTGWTLPKLRDEAEAIDIYNLSITVFLTLRNAGFSPTWEDCLDLELGDVELIEEPGDAARKSPEADASEPAELPADSSADDEQLAPESE